MKGCTMANTTKERAELVKAIITDPDLELPFTEALRHVYLWYMYEINLRIMRKALYRAGRYKMLLNQDVEAFALRVELKDL
jgi:hypothetical protein